MNVEFRPELAGVDWESARKGQIGTAVTLNPEGRYVVLLKCGSEVAELTPAVAHALGRRLVIDAAMAERDERGGDS